MISTPFPTEPVLDYVRANYFAENSQDVKETIDSFTNFGGYFAVKKLLIQKAFRIESAFLLALCRLPFVVQSTVTRYYVLNHLIEQGAIEDQNLEGKILDIGCHLGATVDALAMWGGDVVGTDNGRFAYYSPSNRPIGWMEGRMALKSMGKQRLTLITCFNVDWVESMSEANFTVNLFADSMTVLPKGGQILFTFSDSESRGLNYRKKLDKLSHTRFIRIPANLAKYETFAFVGTND